MKKEAKPQSKVKGLGNGETPENNPQLIHYLSPLELAAHKHLFQVFTYYIEDEALHIEPHIARQIYYTSRRHVAALRSILQRSRQKTLKQDSGIKRFLYVPLKDHGLPTRIYHVLRQNDCQNLADVANKGEAELKRMRGMGKGSIRLIMNLFSDNGCGSLFLDPTCCVHSCNMAPQSFPNQNTWLPNWPAWLPNSSLIPPSWLRYANTTMVRL